ncbi:MAG: arsenic resistance N-acetyltransferase ArsN2 [Promethearchaeota archaeon]
MRSDFKIEDATEADYDAVVTLLKKANLPPDDVEKHMTSFLVIRYSEVVTGPEMLIGSVGLEIYGKSALLRSLAVHPDFQGRGLGTRLVNSIIEVAKEKGINRLFLLTDTAEKFFEKKGFVVVTRDLVPENMKKSVEFTTLCTSSPSMMIEI